jgi:hypothetical protein
LRSWWSSRRTRSKVRIDAGTLSATVLSPTGDLSTAPASAMALDARPLVVLGVGFVVAVAGFAVAS